MRRRRSFAVRAETLESRVLLSNSALTASSLTAPDPPVAAEIAAFEAGAGSSGDRASNDSPSNETGRPDRNGDSFNEDRREAPRSTRPTATDGSQTGGGSDDSGSSDTGSSPTTGTYSRYSVRPDEAAGPRRDFDGQPYHPTRPDDPGVGGGGGNERGTVQSLPYFAGFDTVESPAVAFEAPALFVAGGEVDADRDPSTITGTDASSVVIGSATTLPTIVGGDDVLTRDEFERILETLNASLPSELEQTQSGTANAEHEDGASAVEPGETAAAGLFAMTLSHPLLTNSTATGAAGRGALDRRLRRVSGDANRPRRLGRNSLFGGLENAARVEATPADSRNRDADVERCCDDADDVRALESVFADDMILSLIPTAAPADQPNSDTDGSNDALVVAGVAAAAGLGAAATLHCGNSRSKQETAPQPTRLRPATPRYTGPTLPAK